MNLSFVIIRTILGIAFFALGVLLSRHNLADYTIIGNPYLAPTLIALLSGAFGIFAVPFLFERARRWFENLIKTTVAKTLAPWTKQISKQMGKQIGKAVSSRRGKQENKKTKKQETKTSVILDTSAIIDGRLLDILKTGFLDAPLIVPQFVLDELQRLADSHDDLKRQRGRRGLEILEEVKPTVAATHASPSSENADVDKQLVKMAKKTKAKIATVDYNLNKAASVSGIKVLNVNDLANAIKTTALPGEPLTIKVVQPGKEEGQGVGYLSDGTMVVVENGQNLVGRQIKVEVSRVLQTAAGRMVFAKVL